MRFGVEILITFSKKIKKIDIFRFRSGLFFTKFVNMVFEVRLYSTYICMCSRHLFLVYSIFFMLNHFCLVKFKFSVKLDYETWLWWYYYEKPFFLSNRIIYMVTLKLTLHHAMRLCPPSQCWAIYSLWQVLCIYVPLLFLLFVVYCPRDGAKSLYRCQL